MICQKVSKQDSNWQGNSGTEIYLTKGEQKQIWLGKIFFFFVDPTTVKWLVLYKIENIVMSAAKEEAWGDLKIDIKWRIKCCQLAQTLHTLSSIINFPKDEVFLVFKWKQTSWNPSSIHYTKSGKYIQNTLT